MKLSELEPYAAGTVINVMDCPAKTRLESLGVRPGAVITRLFSSVCGDPSAYSAWGQPLRFPRFFPPIRPFSAFTGERVDLKKLLWYNHSIQTGLCGRDRHDATLRPAGVAVSPGLPVVSDPEFLRLPQRQI